MRAAQLLKKHQVEFNTLTCVNAANAEHGLEVYRFLMTDHQRADTVLPESVGDSTTTPGRVVPGSPACPRTNIKV